MDFNELQLGLVWKNMYTPRTMTILKKNRENDDKRGWMVIQPPITKYV